jgi:hypothetical protein
MRMQMLDGFNEGWIEFENGEASSRKGSVNLDVVLRDLIEDRRKRCALSVRLFFLKHNRYNA